MSVSIPKRYRPQVTRISAGAYSLSWMTLPICTCPSRSEAKRLSRRLLGLLLPLSRCTDVSFSNMRLALFLFLVAASLEESGIRPPIVPVTRVVVPRPVTVRQQLALGLPVGARAVPAPPQLLQVMEGPQGPQLVPVKMPPAADRDTGSSGVGGDFGGQPFEGWLSPAQEQILERLLFGEK